MARVPDVTENRVPVSAFCGRDPSGLIDRLSIHVPVHSPEGSMWAFSCVSLYETRVRWLFSQRVFQKTSLPLKKARLTPASRAAVTLARWGPDQYSSCPEDMNILWFLIRAPRRSVSAPEE